MEVYRSKIRGDVDGIEGDEIARTRIEAYANSIRPTGFMVRVNSNPHHLSSGWFALRIISLCILWISAFQPQPLAMRVFIKVTRILH